MATAAPAWYAHPDGVYRATPPLPPLHAPAAWAAPTRLYAALEATDASAPPVGPGNGGNGRPPVASAGLVAALRATPAFVAHARRCVARLGTDPTRVDAVAGWAAWCQFFLFMVPAWGLAPSAALTAAAAAEWALPPGPAPGPRRDAAGRDFLGALCAPEARARAERVLAPAFWTGAEDGLRAFLRVLYRVTQAWLAARDIAAVVGFRGLVASAPGVGFRRAAPRLRPFSWWSSAWRGARLYTPTAPGLQLVAAVPRARILACLRDTLTGAVQGELVVLGGGAADRCWALAWDTPEGDLAAWTERDAQAAAAALAAGQPCPPGPTAPPDPWGRYLPHGSWFLAGTHGRHSVDHAARVLVWANRVARELAAAGTAVDAEVVRWAAVTHDCRRAHEGDDPEHGPRAAAFFRAHAAAIAPALTADQVAQVAYCVQWHNVPDHRAPQLTPELIALKDGDAHDRVRFLRDGRGGCDERQLRTAYRPGADAERLWQASFHPPHPWAAIRAQAQAWGLWPTA